MKLRHFRWIFGILAGVSYIAATQISGTLGISAEWTGRGYRFAGGTAPWALGWAALILCMYVLLMAPAPLAVRLPLPGLFRRFLAFWVDFILGMSVCAPVVGIVPALVEWQRTGIFQWSFERTSQAPGDLAMTVVLIAIVFASLMLYYAVPIVRRRPSPGACVFDYQILPDAGWELTFSQALSRTFAGFLAVAGCWLAPFVAREPKAGKFWLDRLFHTHAVRLE